MTDQLTPRGNKLRIPTRADFHNRLRVLAGGGPEPADPAQPYALVDFAQEFGDDRECLAWLWRARFAADGVHAHCPGCNRERAFRRYATSQQRQSWTCTGCGRHLHPTAGTVFHKSSTTLDRWFYAVYLLTAAGDRLPARRLQEELGVTYKTAWRIKHLVKRQPAS